jgi:hypothetical protein
MTSHVIINLVNLFLSELLSRFWISKVYVNGNKCCKGIVKYCVCYLEFLWDLLGYGLDFLINPLVCSICICISQMFTGLGKSAYGLRVQIHC